MTSDTKELDELLNSLQEWRAVIAGDPLSEQMQQDLGESDESFHTNVGDSSDA